MVTHNMIYHICHIYINPDHQVFDLIPLQLAIFIEQCYNNLGHPAVERTTIWGIYLNLLELLQQCTDLPPVLAAMDPNAEQDNNIPLLVGLQDLPELDYYMGGVGNGTDL
ncbi:hypothetical protein PAXRUDRAFT_42831, partial [Paxillus rubicundulus Ve08.2h10]